MRSQDKSLFHRIHSYVPASLAQRSSDAAFRLSGRPFVYHDETSHPRGGFSRGVVTFSIDFEMAWATQYSRYAKEDCVVVGLREREQVPRILSRMNDLNIAATWATVGHLFLKRCSRDGGDLPHPELPRVPHFDGHWKFTSGDWFQRDPCTDYRTDPAWYAPDLIETILASSVKHEIGCHGFSHLGFGSYCPEEVASAELDACLEVMKPYGIRPRSFVFPGNDVGKLELLARKGFLAVRTFPVGRAEISLPLRLREGIWGVHSSVAVDVDDRILDYGRRCERLKKFTDRAAQTGLAAHFWFHPSLQQRQMEEILFPLLDYCGAMRDKGKLDILTMEQLVMATESAMQQQGAR